MEGQGGSASPRTVGMDPLIPCKLIIATETVVTLVTLFDTLPLMDHFGSIILLVLTMALCVVFCPINSLIHREGKRFAQSQWVYDMCSHCLTL